MPENFSVENKVEAILRKAIPSRKRPLVIVSSIVAVCVLVIALGGGWFLWDQWRSGPMTSAQQAQLDGLVMLVAATRNVKNSDVLLDLEIFFYGMPYNAIPKGDFKTARDWLIQRAGR